MNLTGGARFYRGYRRQEILRFTGVSLLVTAAILMLQIMRPALYDHVDGKVYDVLLNQSRLSAPHPDLQLVTIDDKALAAFGQWPWPRYVLADLIEALRDAGAELVVLDMVLSSRDHTSPVTIREEIRRRLGMNMPLDQSRRELLDNDTLLARQLARIPSVIGYKFLFENLGNITERFDIPAVLPAGPVPADLNMYEAVDVLSPLPAFARAATGAGFTNALPDPDGVIRRVPLMIDFRGAPAASLALASLAISPRSMVTGIGRDLDGPFVQCASHRTHVDDSGSILLRYRGPSGTYPLMSAADVLAGLAHSLRGRIVIIGPTAAGLGDNHVIPCDRVFPGIEIHATVLDNLLTGDAIIRPRWSLGAEAFTTVLCGLVTTLAMLMTGAGPCILLLCVSCLGIWTGSQWLLDVPGYWLSPLGPEMQLILNMSILGFIKFGMEEHELRKRSQELVNAQDATIVSLTALSETRDPETGGHIKRTREYVRILARVLAGKPKFRKLLTRETVELLYKSAPLHDIGKVGIADSILLKPGPLDDGEILEMQRHTILGAETLAEAEGQAFPSGRRSFLGVAREIAYSHHEKWDGSGYPQGLSGTDIPLGGRLMALADVYDALISKRVYKKAIPHEQAVAIISAGRGSHFDPDVVDAFLESEKEFQEVAKRFS